jgi:hypothetical protein
LDTDLKPAAIAAAGMLVLSTLIGILFGVPFLTIVVRALLFGLLAGGFLYGGVKLIRAFVPDLLDKDAVPGATEKAGVDILVEDDEDAFPMAGEERRSSGESEAEPAVRAVTDAEDVDQELSREAEALRGERLVHDDDAPERSKGDMRPPDVFDDLDVLPDMTAFSDSFGDAHSEEEPSSDMPGVTGSYPEGSGSGSRSGSSGVDPVEMAKAVRTILSKDGKG